MNEPGVSRLVLMITPGGGQDEGGIQRFTQALRELLSGDAEIRTVEVGAERLWRTRLAVRVLRAAWSLRRRAPVTVLCLHGAFLPLAAVAAAVLRGGVVSFFYGQEIWSAGWGRRLVWRYAEHVPVTISGYSAGALAAILRRPPAVLLPPLPGGLAGRFVGVERAGTAATLRVLSVFRLSAAQAKRPHVVIEAVEHLRGEGFEVELCFAGRGPVASNLVEAAVARPWVRIVESPSDDELVACYSDADVFVLATGVSLDRRRPSGEGFGIVLVEAALAGLPVIGPAGGGSRDALVDGYTGEVVADERATTLADALRRLALDPARRQRQGRLGRQWATEAVSAERTERNRMLLRSLLDQALAGCRGR